MGLRISTPPRGVSLLQAMVPSARNQVEKLTDILVQSELENIAVNILCDSGFGWDPDYLIHLVQKLSSDGMVPHFLFYLTSGPSARAWQSHHESGYGAEISPEMFRELIEHDKEFQLGFQQLLIRLFPVIELINTQGGVARVVPQLEDNQTDESFNTMIELLHAVLPAHIKVELGRNSCVGCYPGNQGLAPAGCFCEYHLHSGSIDFNYKNGIISNDGCTYVFPGEPAGWNPSLPLEDFQGVQQKAGDLNNWFLLWSAKYQGLESQGKSPMDRDYPVSTDRECQLLNAFLQKH